MGRKIILVDPDILLNTLKRDHIRNIAPRNPLPEGAKLVHVQLAGWRKGWRVELWVEHPDWPVTDRPEEVEAIFDVAYSDE